MEEKFAVLRPGPNYNTTETQGYNTLKQAADDGAVVLAYGYTSLHFLIQFYPYELWKEGEDQGLLSGREIVG